MISQYNKTMEDNYGVKHLMMIFLKRLTMRGFIVSDPPILEKYAVEHATNMMKWIFEGTIKTKEAVTYGMDNAVDAYLGMINGDNFGKTVLEVAKL